MKLIADKYGHERDDSGCFESATEDISLEKSVDTVEPWKQKILEIRVSTVGYCAGENLEFDQVIKGSKENYLILRQAAVSFVISTSFHEQLYK